MRPGAALLETLARAERRREADWADDPLGAARFEWRAQTVRHLVHLLPGHRVLELGGGSGRLTRELRRVSRGECAVASATFAEELPDGAGADAWDGIERLRPTALAGRRFDAVVLADLLDGASAPEVLRWVYDLLEPGGRVVVLQENPWNLPLNLARRLRGRRLPVPFPPRAELQEMVSALGYVRVASFFSDFAYAGRWVGDVVSPFSSLLASAPGLRTMARGVVLQGERPLAGAPRRAPSLAEHPELRGAVSVVVPCLDEEDNVEPLVRRLRELYDPYLHEIVLVDDSSRDGTREVMRRLAAEDPRVRPVFRALPRGVGRALTDGYRAATGRWVLSLDCDFQHLLPEVRDLFDAAAEGADVVVGSRFSPRAVLLHYAFAKVVANRGFHLLARLLLRRPLWDLSNNLKLLSRDVVERLQLAQPGFAANAETGLQPLLMGYDVREVPVSWVGRGPDMGSSSFRLVTVGGGYGRVLLDVWLRAALGLGTYRDLPVGERRGTLRRVRRAPALPPPPPAAPAAAREELRV